MGSQRDYDPVSGGKMMDRKIIELQDVAEAFGAYTRQGEKVYVINDSKELRLFSDLTISEYKWLMEHPNNNFIFFVLGDMKGETMNPFSHCFN